MAKPRSDVPAARRAFVSLAALCLFALQTLLSASVVQGHGAPAGVSASSYCEPHRDAGAPPAERDHAPCCILCVAGRDLPGLAEPAFGKPTLAPPVSTFAFFAYVSTAPPAREPVGWASTWSSRAPPLA